MNQIELKSMLQCLIYLTWSPNFYQINKIIIYYLSDFYKPRKCCQWTEMRHLPSISSDFRQLRGLTGHTRHRKTNKKRNTGSVSQSLSSSISFNRWIFIKLRSVKGREGAVGTSQPSQQTILRWTRNYQVVYVQPIKKISKKIYIVILVCQQKFLWTL